MTNNENTFEAFPKIPRLSRECVITEKIDGTNAQVWITEDNPFVTGNNAWLYQTNGLTLYAGSRNRWLTPESDNYGFAAWVKENAYDLLRLGPGRHFGEWWGAGIQRRYGQTQKWFSLFNVDRWTGMDELPKCCLTVPVLYRGIFTTDVVDDVLRRLQINGSFAAPGFKDPEGIIIWHSAARQLFKKTIKDDASPKGAVSA